MIALEGLLLQDLSANLESQYGEKTNNLQIVLGNNLVHQP